MNGNIFCNRSIRIIVSKVGCTILRNCNPHFGRINGDIIRLHITTVAVDNNAIHQTGALAVYQPSSPLAIALPDGVSFSYNVGYQTYLVLLTKYLLYHAKSFSAFSVTFASGNEKHFCSTNEHYINKLKIKSL